MGADVPALAKPIPGPSARWLRSPGSRAFLGIAAVAVLGAPVAFYGMFSGFRDYDDEGYLLLSLREYAGGAALYDQLYTQYGPAYFQLTAGLFHLLGLPFTHASGRAVVMALWLAVAALCAVVTYRLTRNLAVTLGSQLLAFGALVPLRNEPLHPGGLLALLVAGIVVAGSGLRATRASPGLAALMGALVALAAGMKLNVGVFALASCVFCLLVATPPGPSRAVARAAAVAGFVFLPVLLMAPLADAPWVRAYMTVVTLGAAGVAAVELADPAAGPGAIQDLAVLVTAFGVASAAIAGLALLQGTSLAGLVHGTVLDPLAHPSTAPLALPIAPVAPGSAGALFAVALLFAVFRDRLASAGRAAGALQGIAQIAAGLYLWLAVAQELAVEPIGATLGVAWLALTAPLPDAERRVGRSLLVAVAVLQTLHAYPVAGSQVAWATFLLIPVGGVLIAGGWTATIRVFGPVTPVGHRARRVAATALGLALLALAAASAARTASWLRAVYQAGVPLGLPGAETIRVRPSQARRYRALVANVARCRTFVTLPGLNSLYLFARRPPPTMLNATAWMTLLTPVQQQTIVDRLAGTPAPVCAVHRRDPALDAYDTPLVRYVKEEFVPLFTVDGYAFLVRRPRSGSAVTGD